MIFTLVLFAVSLVAFIFVKFISSAPKKHLVDLMNQFEGPPSIPILGNVLLVVGNATGEYLEEKTQLGLKNVASLQKI